VDLPGGVRLGGTLLEGGEATELVGTLAGSPLELPSRALVILDPGLPGVAGGPADPETWDRHFGPGPGSEGDAERQARQRKAEALPGALADLYREVRSLRHRGGAPRERLWAILGALEAYPGDWLLAEEVKELLGSQPTPMTAGAIPAQQERP